MSSYTKSEANIQGEEVGRIAEDYLSDGAYRIIATKNREDSREDSWDITGFFPADVESIVRGHIRSGARKIEIDGVKITPRF